MRRVIFEASVSLDGFIEGPNSELDWLVSGETPANAATFLSAFDTIFFGRKAYEKLGIIHQSGEDIPGDGREFFYAFHRMRKYVFSKTLKHVAGNGMVISENLETEVKRIRAEEGKDIWLCGGADIMRTFATLDLIDAYFLIVHPVTLHSGTPLFEAHERPSDLSLAGRRNLKSGVVILQYLPESRSKNEYDHGGSF